MGSRPSDMSFTFLYVGAALGCGLLALYKEKPVIITTTALLGAFAFCVGVGYFQHCNFMTVAELLEHDIGRPLDTASNVKLDECDRVLAFGWLFLSVLGVLLQYRSADQDGDRSAKELAALKSDGRFGAAMRPPRELLVVREYRSRRRRRDRRRDRRERAYSPEPNARTHAHGRTMLVSGAESSSSTTSRWVTDGKLAVAVSVSVIAPGGELPGE